MRFKPPNCKRLQGAADARRRARRRTFVLQVPDNKADAVPCERLQLDSLKRIGRCNPVNGYLPKAKGSGSLPAFFQEGGIEKPEAMGIGLLRTEGLVASCLRQPGILYGLVGLAQVNLHYFHNVFDFHVAFPVKVIPPI